LKAPRVGVVGARRARQGLGPFVARDLARAGAQVRAFVATSEATRAAGARELARIAGVEARGYLSLPEMLAREELDALAILSPAGTHEAHLETALEARLHVLCEKPFLWQRPKLAERSAELAAAFGARGLLLFENCQWPYTLAAYRRLHPGALEGAPARFEMRMQPASGGVQLLGDSAPHALSLLQAALPGAGAALEAVRFAGDPEAGSLAIEFRFQRDAARTEVRLELSATRAHPREAAYAFDGRWARRSVEPDSYALAFADGPRQVPVPDPMAALVADFVDALRRPDRALEAQRGAAIAERMALLEALVLAFQARFG
jgi:predicted dehydrogenase